MRSEEMKKKRRTRQSYWLHNMQLLHASLEKWDLEEREVENKKKEALWTAPKIIRAAAGS